MSRHKLSCHKQSMFHASQIDLKLLHLIGTSLFLWGSQSWGFIDQQLWHLMGTLQTQPNAQFHDTYPQILWFSNKSIQGDSILPTAISPMQIINNRCKQHSKTHLFHHTGGKEKFPSQSHEICDVLYIPWVFGSTFFPYHKIYVDRHLCPTAMKQNCSVFHDFIALRRFPLFRWCKHFSESDFRCCKVLPPSWENPSTNSFVLATKCWSSYCWLWDLYWRSSPTYLPRQVVHWGELWNVLRTGEISKIPCWPLHPSWVFPPIFFRKIRKPTGVNPH